MKIALVGASGVGKTTLLEHFTNLRKVTGITRLLKSQYNIPLNEQASDEGQLIIFNEYWKQLIYEDDFVTDRSILDVMIYSCASMDVSTFVIDYMDEACRRYLKLYDYIFYIPKEFPTNADGIRSEDEKYHMEIDKMFRDILLLNRVYQCNMYVITGTVKEREAQIDAVMKLK